VAKIVAQATAGIGVWYADHSEQNIQLRLESTKAGIASNSRAELGAIPEALRQNERDDCGPIKSILIRLRKWVTGHVDNYGNSRADALANAGRESNTLIETDEEDWPDNHPARHNGARLQTLEATKKEHKRHPPNSTPNRRHAEAKTYS
jgi:ribonuclease HI